MAPEPGAAMSRVLGQGVTRIWRIALSGPSGDSHLACLDEAERRRADAFKFERDRHRFIRAHDALRRRLSGVCGGAPEKLALQADEQGKPMLPAEYGVHFNLSHSEDQALLAISHAAPVGVDLEKIRPLSDADALAERHFSARECVHLQTLPAGPVRERAFFLCWTRKEAFVKCTGVGLRTDLRRIESGFVGDVMIDGVVIRSLPDVDDFAAALAIEGGVAAVEILDYRDTPG